VSPRGPKQCPGFQRTPKGDPKSFGGQNAPPKSSQEEPKRLPQRDEKLIQKGRAGREVAERSRVPPRSRKD